MCIRESSREFERTVEVEVELEAEDGRGDEARGGLGGAEGRVSVEEAAQLGLVPALCVGMQTRRTRLMAKKLQASLGLASPTNSEIHAADGGKS